MSIKFFNVVFEWSRAHTHTHTQTPNKLVISTFALLLLVAGMAISMSYEPQ